jgi:hypothetical protein
MDWTCREEGEDNETYTEFWRGNFMQSGEYNKIDLSERDCKMCVCVCVCETGSGSCIVVGFCLGGAEPSGPTSRELV